MLFFSFFKAKLWYFRYFQAFGCIPRFQGGGVNAFASALTGGSRCLRGTCRNGHLGTQAHPSEGVGATGQEKAALV